MPTKTEITVEFNKNNTKFIEAGSYILSMYSIRSEKLDTGESFLNFPIVFSTVDKAQRILNKVEQKEDNFPGLNFDDNVELNKLINKLSDLNSAYMILKYENINLSAELADLTCKYIIWANKLLIKAKTANITILNR